MSSTIVTAIVIGAGSRGFAYAAAAKDSKNNFKIVGVAEPRAFYRKKMAEEHSVSENRIFKNWEEVVKVERFADCVLITTMDQIHKDPALAFADMGYHIFLEKPMATTYPDCQEIVKCCKKNEVMLAVGHVLRYDWHSLKIQQLIEEGSVGQVVNIQHLEPIGYWHFAHSFVRGNWNNSQTSSFLLLAKCCHDLDLIQLWMGGSSNKCRSIASFGSLMHFRKDQKPSNASSCCMDCPIEGECAFSAKKLYMGGLSKGHLLGFPVDKLSETMDIESVTNSLINGPYGKCVYDCDNDVMDNQVVILQYENGSTVNFSTVAFTEKVCARQTKIFGTKGEIQCDFDKDEITLYNFQTNKKAIIKEALEDKVRSHGHKDADLAAILAFVKAVRLNDPSLILTGPEDSLRSHYLCFAAEKARLSNQVIRLTDSADDVI